MKIGRNELLKEKEHSIAIRRLSTYMINLLFRIKMENDEMIYFKDNAKNIDHIIKINLKSLREIENKARDRIREINMEL